MSGGSYMKLRFWKRITIEATKKKKIIELLDNPHSKAERIRIDENFAFRTRAERFQQLNEHIPNKTQTLPTLPNQSANQSSLLDATENEPFYNDDTSSLTVIPQKPI